MPATSRASASASAWLPASAYTLTASSVPDGRANALPLVYLATAASMASWRPACQQQIQQSVSCVLLYGLPAQPLYCKDLLHPSCMLCGNLLWYVLRQQPRKLVTSGADAGMHAGARFDISNTCWSYASSFSIGGCDDCPVFHYELQLTTGQVPANSITANQPLCCVSSSITAHCSRCSRTVAIITLERMSYASCELTHYSPSLCRW